MAHRREIDIDASGGQSLVERSTGRTYAVAFRTMKPQRLRKLRWVFDWHVEARVPGAEVFGLFVTGRRVLQGLVAVRRGVGFYEVLLAESAPQNRGARKEFDGVGKNLFAIACRKSLDAGFGGGIAFTAKSALIRHYQRTLGARQIGRSSRMVIDDVAAMEILERCPV